MAFFPCARGHANPRSKNYHWYCSYGSGIELSRITLRLCEIHSLDVQEYLAKLELMPIDPTAGVAGDDTRCIACRKPTGQGDWQVFITGYPPKQEREDYWSKLHTTCAMPSILTQIYRAEV
jgi:hypothetical protein